VIKNAPITDNAAAAIKASSPEAVPTQFTGLFFFAPDKDFPGDEKFSTRI